MTGRNEADGSLLVVLLEDLPSADQATDPDDQERGNVVDPDVCSHIAQSAKSPLRLQRPENARCVAARQTLIAKPDRHGEQYERKCNECPSDEIRNFAWHVPSLAQSSDDARNKHTEQQRVTECATRECPEWYGRARITELRLTRPESEHHNMSERAKRAAEKRWADTDENERKANVAAALTAAAVMQERSQSSAILVDEIARRAKGGA